MFVSKRIVIIAGVIVVVVMLAAGVGLAYAFSTLGQQNTAYASLSATATAAITPTVGAHKSTHKISGIIQSLGTSSFMLSINKGKKTITVNVDISTKYIHNGQKASFTDLQVGQIVAVQGTFDATTSTAQATRVVISPPAGKPTATPTPVATATP